MTAPDLERIIREGVTAARDAWVDGMEFDDAVAMGVSVALGLAGAPMGWDDALEALKGPEGPEGPP